MKFSERKTEHVWIVEMFIYGKWLPTVGATITREQGLELLEGWRLDSPSEKFRLTKYIRP